MPWNFRLTEQQFSKIKPLLPDKPLGFIVWMTVRFRLALYFAFSGIIAGRMGA